MKRKSHRSIWAWSLFDFANSPFTTLVVTFIYAAYFTKSIAADELTGTILWSRVVTITALVVAFLSPFLGAIADRGGFRKSLLMVCTWTCIGATAMLYTAVPGQVYQALGWFLLANIAFETGNVFYNAFLPDIAPAEKIGFVSGLGWSIGYFGGLMALTLALVGFVQTDTPWFGFSTDQGANIRATCLLVAVWFLVFSLPMFIWVKEPAKPRASGLIRQSAHQLVQTCREIRHYRQIIRFLVARLLYNDGLVTVFAFGGIYAAGTFNFSFSEILVFGIALNITAGSGALVMGFLDDRLGGKKTIQISLTGLLIATLIAVFAPNKTMFWVAGLILGIFAGPTQSASRSLMGRFVPDDKENEFFGFFAFSGKATAFIGPACLGVLTQMFDSQRAGISIVLVLFLCGLVVLHGVDEEEGKRIANRSAQPDETPGVG